MFNLLEILHERSVLSIAAFEASHRELERHTAHDHATREGLMHTGEICRQLSRRQIKDK